MKKLILFTIVLFFGSSLILQAQTNKKNYFLAGASDLSHSFGSSKTKYDGNTDVNYKYAQFNFQPMVGYFFINNLVGGLFIDWSYERYKDPDDDDKYSWSTFTSGPFVRYYIMPQDRIKPFVHGQIGLGFYREKDIYSGGEDIYKEGVFTHKIGGGVDFFFNDHVAVGAMLGFCHEAYKEKDEDNGGERAESYKYIYDEFFMQIGVTVILGKN